MMVVSWFSQAMHETFIGLVDSEFAELPIDSSPCATKMDSASGKLGVADRAVGPQLDAHWESPPLRRCENILHKRPPFVRPNTRTPSPRRPAAKYVRDSGRWPGAPGGRHKQRHFQPRTATRFLRLGLAASCRYLCG